MISFNGVNYHNNGSKVENISEEEYQALVQAGEVDPNTIYFRYDGETSFPPVQNDGNATSLIDESIPTGQTIDSVLNSNFPNIGSNQNGTYFKFQNGLLICIKSITQTVTFGMWGQWYESTVINFGDFAYPFSAPPQISANLENSGLAGVLGGGGNVTATSAGYTRLYRPSKVESGSVSVSIIAIGRWK